MVAGSVVISAVAVAVDARCVGAGWVVGVVSVVGVVVGYC